MIKSIVVVSDLHVGSIYGMLPPDFMASDDRPVALNVGQQFLWKCWQHFVEKVAAYKPVAVIANGDLIDGLQPAQRGTELCLPLLADQTKAAQDVIGELLTACDNPKLYVIAGTAYHTSPAAREEEVIAQVLKAQMYRGAGTGRYVRQALDLDVDGVLLNFAHAIGVTTGSYRATAIDKEALFATLAGREGKAAKCDGIVRCLSEDTEVLTRRGWRRHDEFDLSEEVLAFKLDSGELEWQRPTHKVVNDVEPIMVNIKAKGLDLLVSPDHAMVVSPSPASPWRKMPAHDLIGRARLIPVAGTYNAPGVPLSNEQMRLLGLILADGNVVRTTKGRPYAFRISQRESNTHEVERCITDCGYTATQRVVNNCGRTTLDRNGKDIITRESTVIFYIAKEFAADLLPWVDPDKVLNLDMLESTREQFYALLDGLMLGDGSSTENRFYNTNKILLDQMQELMVKHGIKSSVRVAHESRANWKTSYALSWTKRDRLEINQNRTSINVISYAGKSWCITVPSGAIVIRRNGGVAICGNSHVHSFTHVELPHKHALTTPCWQLQTEFCRKKSQYRMLPDVGGVVLWVDGAAKRAGEDGIRVEKVLYQLPTPTVTKL